MSEKKRADQPYRLLGENLKSRRQKLNQTVPEVSGAVEIDTNTLEQIESGEQRPAEEILALLISYFDLQEEDAVSLWHLAGYDERRTSQTSSTTSTFELNQPIAMMMPVDLRVVYTDMVHVTINNFGVVMNFMQTAGQGSQPLAISRIGMSKEHARSVLDILERSLKQSDDANKPKLLHKPSPLKKADQSDKPKEAK
ncbi:MAG: helix-turn-helix transcriptional regulator [Candidatus Saccharibacteria bacterium]|nr:helix-turn-helix transcriptional regulator [Candidatus Saccharibacteria bacterium]